MKGATIHRDLQVRHAGKFQSTLPMKGATMGLDLARFDNVVSIHAPNEGSDSMGLDLARFDNVVSIHAPNEGSDLHHPHLW